MVEVKELVNRRLGHNLKSVRHQGDDITFYFRSELPSFDLKRYRDIATFVEENGGSAYSNATQNSLDGVRFYVRSGEHNGTALYAYAVSWIRDGEAGLYVCSKYLTPYETREERGWKVVAGGNALENPKMSELVDRIISDLLLPSHTSQITSVFHP